MKLFLKADVDEAEIIPRARFSYIRVWAGDVIRNKMLIVRTPFKRWGTYVDSWSFEQADGWRTHSFAFFYLPKNRKFGFSSQWEPLDTNDWK